ncbi:MAG: DUF952 domain-containing protein [Hyphomicrobiaceae bacterium]
MVYKILRPSEWRDAQEAGCYRGSADDHRDGFIHLSTAEQLSGTLARHFAGEGELLLLGFEQAAFGEALRWEAARNGQIFPHVYGVIDPAHVIFQTALKCDAQGRHVVPEGLR